MVNNPSSKYESQENAAENYSETTEQSSIGKHRNLPKSATFSKSIEAISNTTANSNSKNGSIFSFFHEMMSKINFISKQADKSSLLEMSPNEGEISLPNSGRLLVNDYNLRVEYTKVGLRFELDF